MNKEQNEEKRPTTPEPAANNVAPFPPDILTEKYLAALSPMQRLKLESLILLIERELLIEGLKRHRLSVDELFRELAYRLFGQDSKE